ncbi:MAG: VCBS repeat-containing protein [candidate division Zixibacteria bacterium]|nr:VCBS repeat-containing protein [candidate division Zixibacteria bacterium]
MNRALIILIAATCLSSGVLAGDAPGVKSDGWQNPSDAAALTGKIYVTNVTGGFSGDTGTFTFRIALKIESLDPAYGTKVSGFTNAFQITTPNGAVWDTVKASISPVLMESWGDNVVSTVWADNVSPDSVGFKTTGQPKKFLTPGTYDGAFLVGVLLNLSDTGKTICLDSLSISPLYLWDWKTNSSVGSLRPQWGGKFCFTVPVPVTHTISASAGPGGTISPSGLVTVTDSSDQSFTITPDVGYHIVDVLVDGSSIGAQTSYTFHQVVAGHTISATFAINNFTVTATAGEHGTISPSGIIGVSFGDSLALAITPDVGHYIADVVVDDSSIGPVSNYTFKNISSNHTINATFAVHIYFITASALAHGTISPSGPVPVPYGSDQAFTFTPDPGYLVNDIVVDGESKGKLADFTFSNVTANHSILAIFNDTSFVPTQQYQADIKYMNSSDFDQDNYTDIVYSSSGNATTDLGGLWVAFGHSGGLFDAPVRLLGARSTPMVIDFFNADTMPDIAAVGSIDGQYVYLLLNKGNRSFGVDSTPYAGAPITSIASGHINGDQYADIILGNGTIIYGGPGKASAAQPVADFIAEGINVADFNVDGWDDLAIRHQDSTTIYLNDRIGGFAPAGSLFVDHNISTVPPTASVGDLDKDGVPDIACVAFLGADSIEHSRVTVGFGDGLGGFKNVYTTLLHGEAVSALIADVDRDYNLDVAVSSGSALDEKVIVLYGDGLGNFPRQSETLYPHPAGNTVAMASGDLDRDGNPDFITGAYQGPGPITIMYSTPPDEPVLNDEMVVTAFSGVHSASGYLRAPASGSSQVSLQVYNPDDYWISDGGSTVSGSFYWQLDVDQNNMLDDRTVDYNMIDGEYTIVVQPQPNVTNPVYSVAVGVDGSQQATVALNSDQLSGGSAAASPRTNDSAVYYFRVEQVPAISPQSGIATPNSQPVIDWTGLAKRARGGLTYDFQLSKYTDFRSLIEDVQGLTESKYFLKNALDREAVYYWRVREVIDGQPGEWWHHYALYISSGCCSGIRGNVDCDPTNSIDISDLTALIDNLFISLRPLCCAEEGNIDGLDGIDASDLSWLISYLYNPNFAPPVMCGQ